VKRRTALQGELRNPEKAQKGHEGYHTGTRQPQRQKFQSSFSFVARAFPKRALGKESRGTPPQQFAAK
jgi:hypothetical protein